MPFKRDNAHLNSKHTRNRSFVSELFGHNGAEGLCGTSCHGEYVTTLPTVRLLLNLYLYYFTLCSAEQLPLPVLKSAQSTASWGLLLNLKKVIKKSRWKRDVCAGAVWA